jgi:peptide/nickel transport system substrate-binding protein
MITRKWLIAISLLTAFSLLLAACGGTTATTAPSEPETVVETVVVTEEVETVVTQEVIVEKTVEVVVTPTPQPTTRKGGWLDQVVFTEQNDAAAAVKQLQAGEIDVYAYSVSDPELLKTVQEDPGLAYTNAFGSYTEITANPVQNFIDGRLNPFGNRKVREAMNMLIDRNYVVQEIYGGLANPKLTTLNSAFPDYARYIATARALEAEYAYSPEKAKEIIDAEMTAMGATLGADGKWMFKVGEEDLPVTIIMIIRTEDERTQIGDYVASQLETIGFTVDRQYKTRTEASPIWNRSDPNEGQWNLYTGGWITTAVSRDDATNFGYFYTNRGSGSPLWQNYVPTEEFDAVSEKLWVNDFTTMEERGQLFEQALALSLEDSVRIWVADQTSFSPTLANVQVAYDLAGGIAGAQLWPYTLRFVGEEGGVMRMSQPGILVEPWNPVAGSNWIYDQTVARATGDAGMMSDPYTGLNWPLRIESANIVVKEGLPVAKTLDWIGLETAASIEVPADAWADWNAVDQVFVTVGEKYTDTLTANVKSTVCYPADLWTAVKWHDGSPLTMGDFAMGMIMAFERAKPESANYDESAVPAFESFISTFKGVKVISTDPLCIEDYRDQYYLDAEWSPASWWPAYGFGTAPWHTMVLGLTADASKDKKTRLAFSADKSTAEEIEWMSFISGPSLEILKGHLDELQAANTIPFAPTLGTFVTAEEATARYTNLQNWYAARNHFWVGTGPYYLYRVYPTEGTVTIQYNPEYPDLSNRWDRFGSPMMATAEIDGPAQVAAGEEAAFDIYVTYNDAPYPSADIATVKYLVFDATGALVTQGDAAMVEEGKYGATLGADVTGAFTSGAYKLEVAVASKAVSIPAFAAWEFVVP